MTVISMKTVFGGAARKHGVLALKMKCLDDILSGYGDFFDDELILGPFKNSLSMTTPIPIDIQD